MDPGSSDKSPREKAAFFQDWLFFSLIEDVLQDPIDRLDFVTKNRKGQLVLTTRALPALVQKWYYRDQRLSLQEQEVHGQRFGTNLRYMCDVMCAWSAESLEPFDHCTTCYLGMLGNYFNSLYRIVYEKAFTGRESSEDEEVLALVEAGSPFPTAQ